MWFDDYVAAHPGISATPLRQSFAIAYSKGKILKNSFVRELYPTLSDTTILRWDRDRDQLRGRPKKQGRKSKIPDDFHDEIVALIAQGWKATQIHELLTHEGIDIHISNVCRFVATWKSKNQYKAAIFANPDKARGKFTSAIGSQGARYPNERWELDSTLSDIVLADGKRYAIIGGIDVYSRRCRFFVSPTSSADAVMALMRQMLLQFGKPDSVKTDRGKDYLSKYLSGALEGLGITHKKCQPRTPVQKPHIERLFHTLCDDLLAREQGFLGRSVDERKALQSRIRLLHDFRDNELERIGEITSELSPDQFQVELDKWCDYYESVRIHSSLGTTPMQKWIEGIQGRTIVRFTEQQLDILLAPAPKASGNEWGQRKANKGCIEVNGLTYVAPELMLDGKGQEWNGRLVHCRYDILDYSRILIFKDATLQNFICVAECKELMSMATRRDKAKQAKRAERAIKAAAQRVMSEPSTAFEEIKKTRESAAEKVVSLFPRGIEEDFRSASLQQAEESLVESRAATPNKVGGTPKVSAAERPAIRDDRFFCWAYKQLKAGNPLPDEDTTWMRHYLSLSEVVASLEYLGIDEEAVLAVLPPVEAIAQAL